MLAPPTTALGNDDCPVTEVDEVHSHRRSAYPNISTDNLGVAPE